MEAQNAKDLVEAMGGRAALAAAIDVSTHAIRMAERAGKLPANWFAAMERASGRELPRELFTFK